MIKSCKNCKLYHNCWPKQGLHKYYKLDDEIPDCWKARK